MKRLLPLLCCCAVLPVVAQAVTVQTNYSCTDAAGAQSLTNIPTAGATCVVLYTSEVADTVPATTAGSAPETPAAATLAATVVPPAAIAKTAAPKTPDANAQAGTRAQAKSNAARAASARRDAVVRETAAAYARGAPKEGNPAVSRRYLKTDRATYIQQNGVVPH